MHRPTSGSIRCATPPGRGEFGSGEMLGQRDQLMKSLVEGSFSWWLNGSEPEYEARGRAAQFAGRCVEAMQSSEHAARTDWRNLLRQLLLHLPRFSYEELEHTPTLRAEIDRLSKKILERNIPSLPSEHPLQTAGIQLRCTQLIELQASLACDLHRTHHYLGSPRSDGIHLGLYTATSPSDRHTLTGAVTLSALDIPHIRSSLPSNICADEVLVVSRLLGLRGAPPNAMSYLLGRTFDWVRTRRPDVKLLLTYLNPNLGFCGTVYRATNWLLFGREHKQHYLYLDGDYVTDRAMITAHKTNAWVELRNILGSRLSRSVVPLRPMDIYYYSMKGRALSSSGASFRPFEFTPHGPSNAT
jgi:hypothetical protein